MTESQAQSAIREIAGLRRQNAGWRIGSAIAIIAILTVGIGNIIGLARGLATPGARQEEFTNELYAGLQRDVVPQLQQIAGRTLAETRPLVEQEFVKIGQRTPELTQAATSELEALQSNLLERGNKVVDTTLSPIIERREAKLKEMFPEATDENIRELLTTFKDEMAVRATTTHDILFGKHVAALNSIVTDMETIRLSEKVTPGTEQVNWELGLAVFDVIREDLNEIAPKNGAMVAKNQDNKPNQPSQVASSERIAKEVK